MEYSVLIILLIFMIAMMFFQSRKMKKQQAEHQNFFENLQPGTQVITIGRIIGTVVEVDRQYEEIVIDSEGSLLRFAFSAISKEYVRPAYVSDDEVDEQGNPLPAPEVTDGTDQEPAAVEETVEETVVTEEPHTDSEQKA